MLKPKLRIFIGTNAAGGDYYLLKRTAQLLNVDIFPLWDVSTNSYIENEFLKLNPFYISSTKALNIFSPRISRILFLYLLVSRIHILESDEFVNLVSSVYIPIPKGENIISYILTPPRIFTIDYATLLNSLKSESKMKYLIAPVARIFILHVYNKSLKNSSRLLTISDTVRTRLKKFTRYDSDVMYGAVDTSKYHDGRYEHYFVCVSRIIRMKRQDFILRAFKLFHAKNSEYKLVFVSPDLIRKEQQVFFNELKNEAKSLNLPVEFLFSLSERDLIEQYSNAYCSLFAGENEDFGLVILEAMASAKPVISIRSGAPVEMITHGITGFLVESHEEMASKMLLLASDVKLVKQMGKEGQARVRTNYDFKLLTEKLKKLIE